MSRLQEIKEQKKHKNVIELDLRDYNWLIEQAEKTERYEQSLKTIRSMTSCDDTWDFANRTLEGKEKLELPYRFNQI